MYRNGEGYNDPTAGAAMGRIMREYKKEQRKKYEIKNRPKVYVSLGPDGVKNKQDVGRAFRFVANQRRIPVTGCLMYSGMRFHVANLSDQECCRLFELALISACEELWCFRMNGEIREGMQDEINEAKRLHIPVRYFDLAGVKA